MRIEMLTAEEFLLKETKCKNLDELSEMMKNEWKEEADGLLTIMKNFAKLHVEIALKGAAKSARIINHISTEEDDRDYKEIDKDSILNAYDLNNIK